MKLKKLLVTSLLACSSLFALSSCDSNNSTIQYGKKYIRSDDFFAERYSDDGCEYIVINKDHSAIWKGVSDKEYYWDFINVSQISLMTTDGISTYTFNYSKSFLSRNTTQNTLFIAENYKVK